MTPDQRAHLHARWSSRTRSERASATVLRQLADHVLTRTGDRALHAQLLQAAEDEAHHGVLCTEVTARLGPPPPDDLPLPGLPPAASDDPDLALIEQVLFLLVTGEHLASALLGDLARTCLPDLQRTLFRIAVDEHRHAQLGWTVLDALLARVTASQRAALLPHVPRAVGLCMGSFRVQLQSPWPALARQWGLADQPTTEAVTLRALNAHVLPGLAQRGLHRAA